MAKPAAVIATVTPATAVLTAGQSQQFTATFTGGSLTSPVWSVNGAAGGSASVGTISASGIYTAPSSGGASTVQITASDGTQTVKSTVAQVSLFNPSSLQSGTVTASAIIPQVASYTLTAPQGASVKVEFGTTTSYGLSTSAQAAPDSGGATTVIVAGMRASSLYHMKATIVLADGTLVSDSDKTFTTGAIPAEELPNLTITQPLGASPADGVELLSLSQNTPSKQLTAVVSDLEGNVIWYYPEIDYPQFPFPIKLLPNGHMLIVLLNEIREVDLAGNLIYGLPLVQVQTALTNQGLVLPPLTNFNHDIIKLPNGHLILLISFTQTVGNPPGTGDVIGNLLVDWDPQRQQPAWTWSTFDHLDVAHAPDGLPDWTHGNALVYSPDDGNLLLSMRNQNWVIKIKYADGAGDGSVLWRLGNGGDFTLPGGVGPVEWNYGQHNPVIVSPNSAGTFSLMFFNNGSTRAEDTANTPCGQAGSPCYSSVPIFQLNESTKEVQVLAERDLSPAYSVCCGSVGMLSNGNFEYDIAFDVYSPNQSTIREETPPPNSQPVWQMVVTGELAYRGDRIPSLYPGVTWSQSAMATANSAVRVAAKSGQTR